MAPEMQGRNFAAGDREVFHDQLKDHITTEERKRHYRDGEWKSPRKRISASVGYTHFDNNKRRLEDGGQSKKRAMFQF